MSIYHITICKDAAGAVRYSVQDERGLDVVPLTVLERGGAATFAHRDADLDVVLIPARGGFGGGPSTGKPPPLGSLRRVTLAKPAPFEAMRQEVAQQHTCLAVPHDLVSDYVRQVRRVAYDRLSGLPAGSKVAVKHEGDGRLSWMEFGPGEQVVVPDESWSAFGKDDP